MLPIADVSWLNLRHRFPALIDIGANDGAFASYLVRALSIPRTIAIEPLPAHAPALRGRGFEVHSVALGNPAEPGEVAFRVSEADAASSILPVTQRCLDEYPQVKLAETIRVPLRRLDDLIAPVDGALVKIDAQGAEADILEGGRAVLERAAVILIEMTFLPLYEGQALFNGVHRRLDEFGFELIGFRGQHASETTGEPIFAHTVYRNRASDTWAGAEPGRVTP